MRDSFVSTLLSIAKHDQKLMLLTADLGFGIFDDFINTLPDQFLNVGVAEQNMIGVSAGLSKVGYKVVAYSIAPFVTLRCLEQIRNDVCYHGSNVVLVGSGGGFTYGALGMSHHAIEDVAVCRAMPSLRICTPVCNYETKLCLENLLDLGGAAYLRLEKNDKHTKNQLGRFDFGKARRFGTGEKLLIFSYGDITNDMINLLDSVDLRCTCSIFSFHELSEIDISPLNYALSNNAGVLVVEEHRSTGGLFDAVLQGFAGLGAFPNKIEGLGVSHENISVAGDQKFLREKYGISPDSVLAKIRQMLNHKQ